MLLVEDYREKFNHLVEYTNAGGAFSVNEDDGPEGPDANAGAPDMGMDPNMGGGQGAPDMGMDPNMGGGQGMPDMGMDPNMGGGQGVEGFNPQAQPEPMMGQEETEEEEEVIDVDELVSKQEETSKKLDKLSATFEKLLDKVEGFKDLIDSSDAKMEELKKEIEKRNPTPVEKLSLRTKDSYPFNITPEEYWKEKEATSNYSTEDDNNGEDMPIYKITKNDIDNFTDYASASKSLDDDYTLRDMFGY